MNVKCSSLIRPILAVGPCHRWLARIVCFASLFFLENSPAFPQNVNVHDPLAGPEATIKQMYHKSWTIKEGAPSFINSITRSNDGYLWIASASGLFRFDGVAFEKYKTHDGQGLPKLDIYRVWQAPDRKLWVAYSLGGVSLIENGKLTNYLDQEGAPMRAVSTLIEDSHGTAWKLDYLGHLSRLEGPTWKGVDAGWKYTGFGSNALLDDKGTLWIIQPGGVSCLPDGERQFVTIPYHGSIPSPTSDLNAGGAWDWLLDFDGPDRPVCGPAYQLRFEVYDDAPFTSGRGVLDHFGYDWNGTHGAGIRRIRRRKHGMPIPSVTPDTSGSLQTFTKQDGLSSDYVNDMVSDGEGNIWAATKGGLDVFRRQAIGFVPFPPDSSDFNLLAGYEGDIWATLAGGKDDFYRISGDRVTAMKRVGNPPSAYRDLQGTIYMGMKGKIATFVGGKFGREIDTQGAYAGAMSKDSEGRLWVVLAGRGICRLEKDGTFTTLASMGAPEHGSLNVVTDEMGRVWVGFLKNTVVSLEGEKAHVFSSRDGISVGDATVLQVRDGRIWIGGERGLEFFDGVRFIPVLPINESSFTGISGIIDRGSAGIWFGETRGIIHIAGPELQMARKDPTYHVKFRVFNALDGLPEGLQPPTRQRTMVEGSNGILWFATAQGLAWIDPKQIPSNGVKPPVTISSLTSGEHSYYVSDTNPVRLPAHTTALQISYAALSIAVPERVKYRYQLDSIDQAWQDAGTRRQAFYTNLGPGKYRFRVVGCNNDGVWNESGAELRFLIAPAFYQTWWFRSFYFAIAVGSLWLLYLYRLRLATAEIQKRLGAQLEERERIARELHDTLLQGFHGLMLRFQAVMKMLPAEGGARELMEKILDRADEVLLEGRESVRDLRESGMHPGELSALMSAAGAELAQGTPIVFSSVLTGDPRALDPVAFNEIYRIAREALSNAFQHSKAMNIELQLTYSSAGCSVKVHDDGSGIDSVTLGAGKKGHWGLSGMRERAQKLGGQLSVWSKPGAGTKVELTVPANIAYPRSQRASIWQRLRRPAKGDVG